MPELKARDAKLIQYLNEAYGKEKELETALRGPHRDDHPPAVQAAPAGSTSRETKGHARAVERRIKQLGGTAEAGAGAPAGRRRRLRAVGEVGVQQRASPPPRARCTRCVAPARRRSSSRTPRREYSERGRGDRDLHGDRDARRECRRPRRRPSVARGIRREEERMQRFLERADPAADEGRCTGGDPRGRAQRWNEPPPYTQPPVSEAVQGLVPEGALASGPADELHEKVLYADAEMNRPGRAARRSRSAPCSRCG